MILYYFNNEDYHMEKTEITIEGLSYNWRYRKAILKSELRKDLSKNYINVSPEEGVVHYNAFWLNEEDDERALKIYKEYMDQKRVNLQKRLERMGS